MDPTIKIKCAYYCGVHTLRDPSGYPSGGIPFIGTVSSSPNWPFLSPPYELEPMRKGTLIASSVGSGRAPSCYKSPFAHRFELLRIRKKRPVGT